MKLMKSSKLGKKGANYLFFMILIIMVVLTISVTSIVMIKTKDSAINNMQIITSERSQIIDNYVDNAEKTLIFYSKAGEIADILAHPEDPEATKKAQVFTESFSKEIEGIEAIYVSEWSTHVLAHTDPTVPGITTRTGDALKPFQDGILAAQGNVSNFGIISSPASGKQVESLLKGIFDKSGNPIGFVGFAVNYR